MRKLERNRLVYSILLAIGGGIALFTLIISLLAGIDWLGAWVSAQGFNVIQGIHIHKTAFGLIMVIGSVFSISQYDCNSRKDYLWLSLLVLIVGVLIIAYDWLLYGVWLPVELV